MIETDQWGCIKFDLPEGSQVVWNNITPDFNEWFDCDLCWIKLPNGWMLDIDPYEEQTWEGKQIKPPGFCVAIVVSHELEENWHEVAWFQSETVEGLVEIVKVLSRMDLSIFYRAKP